MTGGFQEGVHGQVRLGLGGAFDEALNVARASYAVGLSSRPPFCRSRRKAAGKIPPQRMAPHRACRAYSPLAPNGT